ncbi:MAG: DUF3365 domain-containing protein [Nitrospirae bacterium]|nr:DUF3365 domain-containing protein [Nitrospirota bacterium]
MVLITALGISFYLIAERQERLIMKQVENEARAIFKQIVITRTWIADHGGIYVEKLPWVKPNPYLAAIGQETETTDIRGRVFVKENPAMVTKELSKYAKERESYWFHITSLTLTNPENAPDEFEKKALLKFENKHTNEIIAVEKIDKSNYLRYISPLYVEEACLKCHAYQGYQTGDVRGAISITVPLDKTLEAISANKRDMLIAGVIILSALIAAMYFTMKKLVLTPMNRLKTSIKEFSEGNYSPAKKIKTGDEFEDLCCSFSEMAMEVTEYHNCLNDKVMAATTGLEETNEKLMAANRLLNDVNIRKSDFMARASHELRTPLTSIKGAMDYIGTRLSMFQQGKNGDSSLDDLYTFFNLIKKNTDRLIQMVNDMLDIERIEMGASEMQFVDVNLSYLIAETLTYLQVNADEKGISVQAHIPDALCIYADEERIRQALINLLSNAIKFSPANSEIIIIAYHERGYAITEVWDEGIGVPPESQERIFEKFYKSNSKGGAGLGLAICKSIIEMHYGIIGVKSDGKSGSCFYFKIPQIKLIDKIIAEVDPERLREQQKLLLIAKKIGAPC